MDVADEFGQSLLQHMQRGAGMAMRNLNPFKLHRQYKQVKKHMAFKAMAKQGAKEHTLENGEVVLAWEDKNGKPLLDPATAHEVMSELATNNISCRYDKDLGLVVRKEDEKALNAFLGKKVKEIEELEAKEAPAHEVQEELDRDALTLSALEDEIDPRFDTYRDLDSLDPKRALAEHIGRLLPQGPYLAPFVEAQEKRLEELLEHPELTEEAERKVEEIKAQLDALRPQLEKENALVANITQNEVDRIASLPPVVLRAAREIKRSQNAQNKPKAESQEARAALEELEKMTQKMIREAPRLDDQATEAKQASRSLEHDKEKIHERGRARTDSRDER